jgi:hypothetical protein
MRISEPSHYYLIAGSGISVLHIFLSALCAFPPTAGLLHVYNSHNNMNQHSAHLPQCLPLCAPSTLQGYCARQLKRWTQQYTASVEVPMPEVMRLVEWLNGQVPAEDLQPERCASLCASLCANLCASLRTCTQRGVRA